MSKLTLKTGSQEDLDEILKAEEANEGEAVSAESLETYNQTLKDFKEEVVIEGIIRQVNDLEVFVDVKGKSEGIIQREEFKEGEPIEVGSKIEVYIDKFENEDGRFVLSKQKADFLRIWKQVYEAFERGDIVRGTLSRRIKGGVEVDLFGIPAFLPGSQIDLRQIPDINIMIGQEYDLKIIKINKDRRNIVVSRRVVLEDERNKQRGNVLDTLEKNQVRKGIVKNITEFGAFIDLGGVDGLLHITDMSYKRINEKLCNSVKKLKLLSSTLTIKKNAFPLVSNSFIRIRGKMSQTATRKAQKLKAKLFPSPITAHLLNLKAA